MRLWSCGFELNVLINGVENDYRENHESISSAVAHGGIYSLRCNPTATASGIQYSYRADSDYTACFIRVYIYIASAPPDLDSIIVITSSAQDGFASVRLNANRTLELWDDVNDVQIGSDSFPLDLNTYYSIEIGIGALVVTTMSLTGRINGTNFATGQITEIDWGHGGLHVGGNFSGTYDIYFDDIAINDSSGSYQNSWPGEEKLIVIRGNGSNQYEWLKQGGGAADANNYQDVDEVTPDDATTYLKSKVLDARDIVNLENSSIPADATINLVQIGARFAGAAAGSNSTIKLKILFNGESVENSNPITPDSVTWVTNAIANPKNYPLTRYLNNEENPITLADLLTAQIGFYISVDNTNFAYISTVWMYVGYTEAAAALGSKYMPNPAAYSGYHCFVEQYTKNVINGYLPLKFPDGTLW